MLTHDDFQSVHFHSAGGVIALDQQGIIVYSNPKSVNDLFSGAPHIGLPATLFFRGIGETSKNDPKIFVNKLITDEAFQLIIPGKKKTVLISSSVFSDQSETRYYLYIRDISTLKKRERLYTYLNWATEQLSQARDSKAALDQISKMIVPRFANWFSIDLYHDGKIEELVLAHEDPDMVVWARKYRAAYPADLNSETGIAKVLKTGEPAFIPVITNEMVQASIRNREQLEVVQHMNLQSVIIVPIFNKTVVTGAITFVSSTSEYHYDTVDLDFAGTFATHIALALENARLNEAALSEISNRKAIEEKLRLTQMQLKSALSSGL